MLIHVSKRAPDVHQPGLYLSMKVNAIWNVSTELPLKFISCHERVGITSSFSQTNQYISTSTSLILVIIPPAQRKLLGVTLVSLHPSVRPSVGLSVCLSIRPSRIPCLLCSAYSSGWIHFIFIHLIKVCHVWSFLQNFKIFGTFF